MHPLKYSVQAMSIYYIPLQGIFSQGATWKWWHKHENCRAGAEHCLICSEYSWQEPQGMLCGSIQYQSPKISIYLNEHLRVYSISKHNTRHGHVISFIWEVKVKKRHQLPSIAFHKLLEIHNLSDFWTPLILNKKLDHIISLVNNFVNVLIIVYISTSSYFSSKYLLTRCLPGLLLITSK